MELTYVGIVTVVNKKTKAKGFENTKIGDEVKLSWGLGGCYKGAPYVDCYLNGEYVGKKNADTVSKLFKDIHWSNGKVTPPNFNLEEVL